MSDKTNKKTYEEGMIRRREILGDTHVDRAEKNKSSFDEDFQEFITKYAWGEVWTREGLDTKTRHCITIAMMAALGKEHELAMHLKATVNTGVSQDDVKEILQQVGIYAGLPAANTAFGIAKKVFAEIEAG